MRAMTTHGAGAGLLAFLCIACASGETQIDAADAEMAPGPSANEESKDGQEPRPAKAPGQHPVFSGTDVCETFLDGLGLCHDLALARMPEGAGKQQARGQMKEAMGRWANASAKLDDQAIDRACTDALETLRQNPTTCKFEP